MEILSVNTVSNTLTEIIETTDHQKFILVQTFTDNGSELNYSVFNFNGVEVTDEPDVDEMMGRYFSIKDELQNGITSEDFDSDIVDPYA